MKFGKALKAMRNGWPVRRAGWDSATCIFIDHETFPEIRLKVRNCPTQEWCNAAADLLAEDWLLALAEDLNIKQL